jgi:hypothetical protein
LLLLSYLAEPAWKGTGAPPFFPDGGKGRFIRVHDLV